MTDIMRTNKALEDLTNTIRKYPDISKEDFELIWITAIRNARRDV